jgi:biopolymer transport protein ExbB
MLDNKRMTPIIALFGAFALLMSAPALAQTAASTAASSAASSGASAAPADSAAPAASSAAAAAPGDLPAVGTNDSSKLGPVTMFLNATVVVKTVIVGLFVASAFSWFLLVTKLLEMASLNRESDKFLEAFRDARSVSDILRISTSEDFEGNPLADMAAAAASEVELSRQAGLNVNGEHRDSTMHRASAAVSAVQGSLSKRLAGGMQFLASVGANSPFVGLFGTVYGIMVSFINIANSGTTNLAAVAPGISEALLATGFGLFAAIPAVVFYNYFQTRISGYGTRAEGFVAELTNAISRQLDKGA